MLKPFYQGKLDTFCAIYAVLNALRLTHGIRTLKARSILNETLVALAASPEAFKVVLDQETDYFQLVDGILSAQGKVFPLEARNPFVRGEIPDPEYLWNYCREWFAGGAPRAIIFRFLRSLTPEAAPVNRHWTTADRMDGDILHLFDCSHEAEAVLNIRKNSFVTRPEDISKDRLLYIQPSSMRFLRVPF
jgi:hypothetical protein